MKEGQEISRRLLQAAPRKKSEVGNMLIHNMLNKTIVLLICLILLVFPAGLQLLAQEQNYQDLLNRVKAQDKTVDFQALRIAYARTPDYDPYTSRETRNEMQKAFRDKEYQKVIGLAGKILEKNYIDIDAHFLLYKTYKELKDEKLANFHDFVTRGLIHSILKSGDGKTPETAFVVITVGEEYIALAVLGLSTETQSVMEAKGHQYDLILTKSRDTGKKASVYFNIDLPWNRLNKKLKQ